MIENLKPLKSKYRDEKKKEIKAFEKRLGCENMIIQAW